MHKSVRMRTFPFPGRSFAADSVTAMPGLVERLRPATGIRISADLPPGGPSVMERLRRSGLHGSGRRCVQVRRPRKPSHCSRVRRASACGWFPSDLADHCCRRIAKVNRPGLAEADFAWLRGHGFSFQSCVEVGLGLGRRDVSNRLERATRIEPVHPFQRGVFHGLEAAPQATALDELGLEQAVDRLGQRVVSAVAGAADRGLDARLRLALGVANGQVWGGLNRSSHHLARLIAPAKGLEPCRDVPGS